jgi:hypothetical protein
MLFFGHEDARFNMADCIVLVKAPSVYVFGPVESTHRFHGWKFQELPKSNTEQWCTYVAADPIYMQYMHRSPKLFDFKAYATSLVLRVRHMVESVFPYTPEKEPFMMAMERSNLRQEDMYMGTWPPYSLISRLQRKLHNPLHPDKTVHSYELFAERARTIMWSNICICIGCSTCKKEGGICFSCSSHMCKHRWSRS